jgi:hypothetical protein
MTRPIPMPLPPPEGSAPNASSGATFVGVAEATSDGEVAEHSSGDAAVTRADYEAVHHVEGLPSWDLLPPSTIVRRPARRR